MRISSGLVLATAGSGALAFVAPGLLLRRCGGRPTVSLVTAAAAAEDLLDFGSFDDGKKDRDGAGAKGRGRWQGGGAVGGGGWAQRRRGEGGGGVDGPDKGSGASRTTGRAGSIPVVLLSGTPKRRSVAG